jgi:replicative DNA helicase
VPPHSLEAEQSVLGGLMLDNAAFDKIADLISEGDFYRDEHRRIYRQIRKLLERGKPADAVTVAESLDQAGEGNDYRRAGLSWRTGGEYAVGG